MTLYTVAELVCGRIGLWPNWSVAELVCGRIRRQIDIVTYQVRKIKADTLLCLFADELTGHLVCGRIDRSPS